MKGIQKIFPSIGLVEQSQIVASTAVVVAMGTIVTVHVVTGAIWTWVDFITILTVGVIGYVSVYFSLKYGRMLEEQRRELLELNTIAEAVNHSVELDSVLQSSLEKVMELMNAECGWIYLFENDSLQLKHHSGTKAKFFKPDCLVNSDSIAWIVAPSTLPTDNENITLTTTEEFHREGLDIIASIPLVRHGMLGGVLIIASRDAKKFKVKKIGLLQAFGNQISVALQNASLFEQLKQSERLYADLYEYSPDMYHSIDSVGTIISCNLTESRVVGFSKNQIIGQSLQKLYPASHHQQVRENLRKIFELGQELRGMEEQIQRSDGSLIDVSVNISLVRDADGKPTLARIVLRDITEKKKMEEKILQAQKIDSIGSLAGGIAHDFNNILTAILGSASIMRRKIKDDPRWLKYVDLIETTSRRGAAVTRQLLTFARKNNPHVSAVDISVIVDQTLRLFEATTPKSIHIKCSMANEPMIVEGDDGQIQQAFLNLCLNARDAMPDGGILVINCRPVYVDEHHARQFADGKAGHYILLSVADSGSGIPPGIIHRIYEPFFTTKDQGKGTGLGLSVVYGVVRSHNGHIGVESEVNSGTIFTIYIPRATDKRAIPTDGKKQMELVGGTERILLVEDEISIGEIGSDILKDLGYDIEIAQNGRDAIQILTMSRKPFDLIILDMNMPRMGGRATFDRIKEMFPSMKVLVCSGYSATMIDDGNFARSIDGFLQKPYELEEIANKIRTVLGASVPAGHVSS
ncbi:MAG: PAS domain S-box protein [Ignavibacteriae bacterium]|nr:PAS domain S-box protein [Ignavibacteria bacterium]MBI3365331.1 PAS domain S-box protein [Ignavibacteriota bacterium]